MLDPPVVCFSHLRWDSGDRRPHQLMSRCAQERSVIFVEPPRFDATSPRLEITVVGTHLLRVVPHLPCGDWYVDPDADLRRLLGTLMRRIGVLEAVHWYSAPGPYAVGRTLSHGLIVYDCAEDHSALDGASELRLVSAADVMFTGTPALHEAKKGLHGNLHCAPSSVEVSLFEGARRAQREPDDQRGIPHPRVGHAGTLDARIDLALVAGVARMRPDVQFLLLGPIDKGVTLPRRDNIHYLGSKHYLDLPRYMAGWDLAMLPLVLDESTQFVSPTRVLEPLAAGLQVVATPVPDVIEPFARAGLVRTGRGPKCFAAELDAALVDDGANDARRDALLATRSWDDVWAHMHRVVRRAASLRRGAPAGRVFDGA